jgi:hypothetical protein
MGNDYSSGGVQAEDRLGGVGGGGGVEHGPIGALDGAASGVHGGIGDAASGVHGHGVLAEPLGDVGDA